MHLIGLPGVDKKGGHAQLLPAWRSACLRLLRCGTALRGVWTLQAAHVSAEHTKFICADVSGAASPVFSIIMTLAGHVLETLWLHDCPVTLL